MDWTGVDAILTARISPTEDVITTSLETLLAQPRGTFILWLDDIKGRITYRDEAEEALYNFLVANKVEFSSRFEIYLGKVEKVLEDQLMDIFSFRSFISNAQVYFTPK